MKLLKKLKILVSRDLIFFKLKKKILLVGFILFSIFFISGLSYLDSIKKLANESSYTAEVAALPAGNDYFENGYVTPASCGVYSLTPYACGFKGDDTCYADTYTDYPHYQYGGACDAPTPINASCSASHYNCSAGVYGGGVEYPTAAYPSYYAWQWSCFGFYGGSDAYCVELKPAPTGALSVSSASCQIAVGASTCTADLTWSTTNAQGTSAITTSVPVANTVLFNANSGGPSTVSVTGPTSQTYYLYNNTIPLDSKTVNVTCEADSAWDGTKCGPSSANFTLPSCTIVAGNSTCNSTISWTSLNLTGTPSVRQNGVQFSTSATSGGTSRPLTNGSGAANTFTIVQGGTTLTTQTASASCASGGWDTINAVCADPQIVSANITDQRYPPGDLKLTCANSLSYSVLKGGVLFIGPNQYTGPVVLNDVISESEQYTISCIHGSIEDSTSILYDATLGDPTVILKTTETTVDPPASTTVIWDVTNPTASCTLTAKVVCANNACTAAQLANEASINTILSTTNTDSSDPATSRPILNAIRTPAPGHKDSDTPLIVADYKALGRKTIPIKYTTDVTYNCNGTKETKRIRVIKSEEQ